MEPTPRDKLRRTVRRVVHRACRRRLDGESGVEALLTDELTAALAGEAVPTAIADSELAQWVREDEDDFDRAVLISELLARRGADVLAARPVAASAGLATTIPAAAAPATRPVRHAPAIADLLDDMFAQQSASARPAG